VARRGHRWSQTGTAVSDGHPVSRVDTNIAFRLKLSKSVLRGGVAWPLVQYARAEEYVGRLALRVWVGSFLVASLLLVGLVVGLAQYFPNT